MNRFSTRTAGIAVSTLGLAFVALPFAVSASAAPQQHTPVGVCHATSSDTNPYVWITVDDDSVKLQGHLAHRTDPNKTWKSAGTWNGVDHVDGTPKADFIEGLDEGISEAWCLSGNTDPVVDPTDDPTDEPTDTPTDTPTDEPTDTPTDTPTDEPTDTPTDGATDTPTDEPTDVPSDEPTATDVKTDTQAPGSLPSTGGAPQLAHTGSSTGALLGLGGALLATGAIFLVAGRKSENA